MSEIELLREYRKAVNIISQANQAIDNANRVLGAVNQRISELEKVDLIE